MQVTVLQSYRVSGIYMSASGLAQRCSKFVKMGVLFSDCLVLLGLCTVLAGFIIQAFGFRVNSLGLLQPGLNPKP